MDTARDSVSIFHKGDNFFILPVCFPTHQPLSEKESTLKGKDLPSLRLNSFLI